MGSKVTTEFDIDLSKAQAKITQFKADMRAAETAAKQVKFGERLISANADRELQKVAKLKEQIATAGFEGALKELGPQQQLYAITQRIAQLKAATYANGPARESAALQLEAQTLMLTDRRSAILKQITAEKQRAVAAAREETAAAQRLAFIEQARGSAMRAGAMPGAGPAGRGGGRGAMYAGQVGMQVQDVAVQLQMGTSPLLVATQQGSQILSVFGPQGAIVAGLLAIAGAGATMGIRSREGFDKLINGAREAQKELATVARVGTGSEIANGLKQAQEQLAALKESRANETTFGGSMSRLAGRMFGGFGLEDKLQLNREEQERAEANIAKLNAAAVTRSAENLRIEQLRAKGKEFEAYQLELMLQKERELVSVRDSGLDGDSKAALMNDIEALYTLKEQVAWTAELKRRDDKVNEAREKRLSLIRAEAGQADRLRTQMREQAEERGLQKMTPEQQAATLRAKAAELQRQGATFEGEVTEAQKLELQQKINALLERAEEIEKDTAARNERINASRAEYELQGKIIEAKAAAGGKDDATVKALERQLRIMQLAQQIKSAMNVDDATATKMAEQRVDAEERATTAAQQRQQVEAKVSIAKQAAINHAKAHGHKTEAARLQRESDVDARAKQIQEETGATPEEARKQAEEMQKDIDKMNGVRKIRSGRASKGLEGTPGLDPYKANQPGSKQAATSGTLGGQNQQNAANQTAAQNSVSIAEGGRIIALLTSIEQNLTLAA